jgi:hypothetical protein
MVIERAAGQVGDLLCRLHNLCITLLVGEAHHGIGIGDIERVADQRHAERRIEVLQQHRAHLGDAVTIGVAQKRDAVGARRACAGPLLRLRVDHTLDALGIFGPLRTVALCDQDIAIRQHQKPARVLEPLGEGSNRKSLCRRGLCALRPALGGGDVDSRDQSRVGLRQRGTWADAALLGQFRGIPAGSKRQGANSDQQVAREHTHSALHGSPSGCAQRRLASLHARN